MAQINVNNLTFAYEGSFDNVFENTSFSIDTNWRLGFVGRNGKGKTTFLNLLLSLQFIYITSFIYTHKRLPTHYTAEQQFTSTRISISVEILIFLQKILPFGYTGCGL